MREHETLRQINEVCDRTNHIVKYWYMDNKTQQQLLKKLLNITKNSRMFRWQEHSDWIIHRTGSNIYLEGLGIGYIVFAYSQYTLFLTLKSIEEIVKREVTKVLRQFDWITIL